MLHLPVSLCRERTTFSHFLHAFYLISASLILSSGAIIVASGTLDVSGGTLSAAENTTVSIAYGAGLTVNSANFGIFTKDGSFTANDTPSILGDISNSGTLTLTGLATVYGSEMSEAAKYNLANDADWIAFFTNNTTGTIVLDGITIAGTYSLTYLDADDTRLIGGDNTVMAGDLTGNKAVTFAGITANTDYSPNATTSTIENGSTLTLTGGSTNIALLDEGSLENSGTLNLGVSGNASTASFHGTLDTTATGESNILSDVTCSGLVTNYGTMNIADDVTFTSGLILKNGSTTNFNGADSTIAGTIESDGTLNFTQNVTLTDTLTITGGTVNFADGGTFAAIDNSGALEIVGTALIADYTAQSGSTTLVTGSGWTGTDSIADASKVSSNITNNTIDGLMTVGSNAYAVLGDGSEEELSEAEATFADYGLTWGENNMAAALFLNGAYALGSSGGLYVGNTTGNTGNTASAGPVGLVVFASVASLK